jgi:hypothetical protein
MSILLLFFHKNISHCLVTASLLAQHQQVLLMLVKFTVEFQFANCSLRIDTLLD